MSDEQIRFITIAAVLLCAALALTKLAITEQWEAFNNALVAIGTFVLTWWTTRTVGQDDNEVEK